MEERIETRAKSVKVWEMWEHVHSQQGRAGVSGRFRYQVTDVVPGVGFTVIWKTLFARLIFRHSVQPTPRGSEILYTVEIKGPFAWFIRWILGNKIRRNIRSVLQEMVRRLENEAVK